MTFDRNRPYNDLPPLPPPGVELETKAVLKKAIAANKALANLRGAGQLIPDQSVLIQALGLQEAKLSSEIENIVTTNDELYRAFADHDGGGHSPEAKEVLRYKDALWQGHLALKQGNRPINTRLYEELFQTIKQTTEGVRRLPGTKLQNPTSKEIIYTPPEGEAVLRDKLANLDTFINNHDDGIDPLIKMAVMHYQFEAIHPFSDGNGRTGRILNVLYLIERKLLDIPVLYLSRYIIEHKDGYYLGLRGITERQDWETWLLYMLAAVEETAVLTRQRIMAIHNLMEQTAATVREKLPKLRGVTDIMAVIFRQPYCKIAFLEQHGIGHRQTAATYLDKLESIGVFVSTKVGREKYYINPAYFELLAK